MAPPSPFDTLHPDWTPQAVGAPLDEAPDLGDRRALDRMAADHRAASSTSPLQGGTT
ncbi:hypothetical protein [Sorangium sp. So ce385]|uniref:hypothetical protein n=1 Tax=Sorangium sp. So ce385 TaxID=3133308 RepID=UPI003F5C6799